MLNAVSYAHVHVQSRILDYYLIKMSRLFVEMLTRWVISKTKQKMLNFIEYTPAMGQVRQIVEHFEKKMFAFLFYFWFGGVHEYVSATEHNMISCPNCPTICKIFFST